MKVEIDIPEYVCRNCHERTDKLYYVRYGIMKLNKEKEWIDHSDPEDAIYRCPKCDADVDYDELKNIGVFA